MLRHAHSHPDGARRRPHRPRRPRWSRSTAIIEARLEAEAKERWLRAGEGVRLVGLAAPLAEHEGATGTIFERNAEAETYGVKLASGQRLLGAGGV